MSYNSTPRICSIVSLSTGAYVTVVKVEDNKLKLHVYRPSIWNVESFYKTCADNGHESAPSVSLTCGEHLIGGPTLQ